MQSVYYRTLRNKSELHLEHLSSIDGLQCANLVSLTKLVISDCIQLKSVTPLDYLVNLTELDLSGCARLDNLNLTTLTNLTTLNLSGCFQLSTLNLIGLVNLKKIILSGCTQFRDLKFLIRID